jgi:hypothetical protein
MPTDLKITELPVAGSLTGDDKSILVSNGSDKQFAFTTLLQYISNNLQVGCTIKFVTAIPENNTGKNGDVSINTSAQTFYQKQNGQWLSVYTIATGTGTSAASAILYGLGLPDSSVGSLNDTYINTASGIFYKKNSSGWGQVFSMQSGPAGVPGPKGDAGPAGSNGKSVLSGTLNPSNQATGTNGDFYINTNTFKVFGPKANGAWGEGVTMVAQDFDAKADKTYVDAIKSSLAVHPVYTAPLAQLSSPQQGTAYEIGEIANLALNLAYAQQDGGTATDYEIDKNSTAVSAGNSFTDSNVVMSATPVVYFGKVAYDTGAVKTNNFGDADATGQIMAGTAISNSLSFRGNNRLFYGPVAAAPQNSAQVRGMAYSQFINAGNNFVLNTGSAQTVYCFWLPPGKTLASVIDQDALNLNITSQYVVSSLAVNDAGGSPVTGTLYTMTSGVPYSTNHKHLVNLQ